MKSDALRRRAHLLKKTVDGLEELVVGTDPLIADTEHQLLQAYGVWGEKKFMGKIYDGTHRTTFVIDENGAIEQVITKVKSKIHAEQILEGATA